MINDNNLKFAKQDKSSGWLRHGKIWQTVHYFAAHKQDTLAIACTDKRKVFHKRMSFYH